MAERPASRWSRFGIVRILPVITIFIISQIILSLMGFVYHEHLWNWKIFMDLTNKWTVSVPQILLFDVFGFVVPGIIAAAILDRSRKEMRITLPENAWIWLIAILGAAIAFIVGGGVPKADHLFNTTGLNVFIYYAVIAISEEGFFRGLLQTQAVKAMGKFGGSFIQILLYVVTPIVLLRLVNEANFNTIMAQTLFYYLPVGVFSTALTEITGTITPSILIRLALALAWGLS